MNINIYRKELKRNRNAFLIWSIIITILISWAMFFYPVIMEGDTVKQMTTFFENPFMKRMSAAFGFNINKMTSILGFYAMYNSMYFVMLASLYSMMFASRVVSKEEHEHTAEFLLSKPVSRIEVIVSKILAWLTYIVALNLLITVVAFVELELLKKEQSYSLRAFLVMSCYSLLGTILFGAIGLFCSLLIKRGRNIISVVMGFVFGGYFIDAISKISQQTVLLGYISPFRFIDHDVTRPGYGFTWWRLFYLLGLSVILIGSSLRIYKQKDILV